MAKITLQAVISATSKGLQAAMEKARAAVQSASARIKQSISGIGDAFDKPIQKSKELNQSLSEQDGKQLMQGLTGMAGKIGIIIAGFKAAGRIISEYVVTPLLNAGKEMREWKNYIADLQTKTGQRNMQTFSSLEQDLKEYARLYSEYKRTGTATSRNALEVQKKKLYDVHGADMSGDFSKAMRTQLQYAQNRQQSALEQQIKALQTKNEQLQKEAKELSGAGGWARGVAGNMGLGGQLSRSEAQRRRLEIPKEQGANQDRIAELQEQLRRLKKRDFVSEFFNGAKAEAQDSADARRKKQFQIGDAFRAYDFNQQDTELQKKDRAAMEKSKKAFDDGVDPVRAKAAAERDIATAMNTRYKEYLDEVKRRAEAMKQARQKELDAQNALIRAQKDLAEAEKDAARERRRELEEDRKRKLTTRLNKYGFDASRKSPTRRQRKNAELDASIADKQQREASGERAHYTRREKERMAEARRMANELKRMENDDRKRQREDAKQQRDRRTSNARKQAAAANMDATATRQQRQQAQRRMEALRGPEAVRYRLREQTRNVLKDYNQLTAPGIGGNFQALATAYTGQLNQIHTDLQRMYQRAFILR